MTAKKETEEPTMEEILASIRRIIAEEGDDAKTAAEPAEPVQNGAVAAEVDVLELTEVVEEAPTAAEAEVVEALELSEPMDEAEEVSHAFAHNNPPDEPGEEAPPAVLVPEPEPDSHGMDDLAAASADDLADAVDPADLKDAIMSEHAGREVSDSFARLSDLLVAGYAGSDKTLEGMVREMLKPMLKEWLDRNLPDVVERVVAREVARLARVKRP